MSNFLSDPTVWVYVVLLVIALYGTGLFFWWWARKGGASPVFAYVTFIFAGEVIESAMSVYARKLRLEESTAEYIAFLSSAVWPMRKMVTLTALLLVVVHMSRRIFWKQPNGELRRATD